jgi:pyrimidine-nucleoside phosphorylase
VIANEPSPKSDSPINHSPTLNVVELIRKKRSGESLTKEEFRFLLSGYVAGNIPDYQMSSFLMACYFRGMSEEETIVFTDVMLHSGKVIDLSDIPGTKVDKHSTGGVGDKVSIILAPIVASCGVPVPMISGRGLGHTGGTLDKLASIPGFRVDYSIDDYKRILREVGLVMIGQTNEIAPADKKMYALRDVTATVECIPLIAGSIMSKKIAGGADALVLDVKTGRGAFMQSYEQALHLARTLVGIGTQFGKNTVGFITNMDEPLGCTIGNWLEIVESVECLRGTRGVNDHSSDLMNLTHTLAGAMLMLGKKATTIAEGIERSKRSIADGSAYEKFLQLVDMQGGDRTTIENLERYPIPQYTVDVKTFSDGYVAAIDAFELGLTALMLGAGRETMEEMIDYKAGIIVKKKVGDRVHMGETLAVLMTDREEVIEPARARIAAAYTLSPRQPEKPKLIFSLVDADGVHDWA